VTAAVLVALALSTQAGAPPRAAPARTESPRAANAKAVPVEVHAASIEYRYKERRTLMTGDPLVTLTREDATLVCRRLSAELDAGGQIARATCQGDVKLTRGERVVTCETATFENAAGSVTCDGSPVLRDGASVVQGERLVYHLDEDRVTLTRARGTVVQQSGSELPMGRARP
jgi:lipopolysaccharide export system protein LptA